MIDIIRHHLDWMPVYKEITSLIPSYIETNGKHCNVEFWTGSIHEGSQFLHFTIPFKVYPDSLWLKRDKHCILEQVCVLALFTLYIQQIDNASAQLNSGLIEFVEEFRTSVIVVRKNLII